MGGRGTPYTLVMGLNPDTGEQEIVKVKGGKLQIDSELNVEEDIGAPVAITLDGTSKSVAVPPLAKAFRVATKGGSAHLQIDGIATDESELYIPDECIDYYPIDGGTQTLSCYGTAGKAFFRFLGGTE